jgi:uncharacterized protein YqeY
MTIKETIEADLKIAMLAGEKDRVTTLRGLKSSILYAEVAAGKREEGLEEQAVVSLMQKEAKKRQESADLYSQGGNAEKADSELAEKAIIEAYLPEQLSEKEVTKLVDEAIAKLGQPTPQQMGQVIGAVKAASKGNADGALIAKLVKERLTA